MAGQGNMTKTSGVDGVGGMSSTGKTSKANKKSKKDFGVVIIGRNEGERLRRCLLSVDSKRAQIVYVDSASTDGSGELAQSLGASVVDLDMSKPFNAARARNAGFARLTELVPDARCVQFVDGDCELDAGWLDRAVDVLGGEPKLAAVCGLLHEKSPEASIYNRLCDLEWAKTIGEVSACGGIFMIKRSAFEKVGGFDATVAAGEEPELCQRLRSYGWKIRRVDTLMCLHDSAILSFRQWWSRQVRTGYGALDVATRFGSGPDQLFVSTVKSARVWGIGLPAAIASAGMVGAAAGGPAMSAAVVGTGLLALPAQSLRIAARASRNGQPLALAAAYGGLTVISKFAHVLGQWRYMTNRGTSLGAHKSRAPIATDNAPAKPETVETAPPKAAAAAAKTRTEAPAITAPTKAADDAAWQADKARYGAKPWMREQSLWAVAVYRFGRRVDNLPAGLKKKIFDKTYWLLYRATEVLVGVGIPKSVDIGPGFRIHHFGGIFVHNEAKIGANCTFRQGCTLGNRHEDGPVPVLEDDVELGAYSQVLGGVTLGKGAKVGALSVVLCDVPAGASAVGIPAKVVSAKPAGKPLSKTTRSSATAKRVRKTKTTSRKRASSASQPSK